MENLIDVAEIVNTHGLRGEVKVIPRTDYVEFFEEIDGVYLDDGTYFTIKSVKYHKASAILKLDGIDTIESADKMRQKVLNKKILFVNLKIYKEDKKWFGLLNEIIIGLKTPLDSRFTHFNFAEKRVRCGKDCQKGGKCKMCDLMVDLSYSLKEARLIIKKREDEE